MFIWLILCFFLTYMSHFWSLHYFHLSLYSDLDALGMIRLTTAGKGTAVVWACFWLPLHGIYSIHQHNFAITHWFFYFHFNSQKQRWRSGCAWVTFVPSVVLLLGGAGWQVFRDSHGLFCLLGRFIGRGTVPVWGRDTHQQTPITHYVTPATWLIQG